MYSLKTPQNIIFVLRKHWLYIFITFIVCLIIYYMNAQNVSILQPCIMHFHTVDNNISCHYVNENDALPSAEDRNFLPTLNSIFFHETSCRGGLNSRQACAIESASRAHPRQQVYVLFSAPVSDVVYQRSCIAELRRLPNVRFARVHIIDYAKNTPLEDLVAGEPFNKSEWRVEHTSDVLRYLTLYKWGGVYLDTDMLVVKSLTPLGQNWVAKEDNSLVNAAAIAISMDHLGRKLAEAVINELKTTYRPDIWIHNGPGAITRVLHKMCETPNLVNWSSKTCQDCSEPVYEGNPPHLGTAWFITNRIGHNYPDFRNHNRIALSIFGLEVYGPDYFYPVHYSSKDEYFKPGELKNVENAYIHHFWNKLTHDMKIEKDSPYEKLAQKFCPTIYKIYGEEFGS